MADARPNIDEYGRGAAYTPGGMAVGCAVCSTGDVELRLKKAIPRLSDGTPNMHALGDRMGDRCRRVNGTQHGLALGTNSYAGKCWGTCCVFLELQAQGIACRHARFTDTQVAGFLKAKKPIIVPGVYGAVPKVSSTSYTATIPAKGRSDTFTGSHMVVGWDVLVFATDGSIRTVGVSDSDFGSASRPRVPPHSAWSWSVFKAFRYDTWPIVVVDQKLPSLSTAIPWWGSDVLDYDKDHAGTTQDIAAHWTAKQVGAKLATLGVRFSSTNKAINFSDLEAGLEKRHIPYGKQVNLVDVNQLMKPGTGRP